MLIGYERVSKNDGSQVFDLQNDALVKAGVAKKNIYQDKATGRKDDRPGLEACLKAIRKGDTLVVWKLDRLGRDLRHLVNTVQGLSENGVGFKVLTGHGAEINTTTASGKLVFGIFAALAEFERELIRERTKAGLESARARGRKGGRKFKMTKAQVRLAQAAMGKPETIVGELCGELGITRATMYRYVDPNGKLREHGRKLLGMERCPVLESAQKSRKFAEAPPTTPTTPAKKEIMGNKKPMRSGIQSNDTFTNEKLENFEKSVEEAIRTARKANGELNKSYTSYSRIDNKTLDRFEEETLARLHEVDRYRLLLDHWRRTGRLTKTQKEAVFKVAGLATDLEDIVAESQGLAMRIRRGVPDLIIDEEDIPGFVLSGGLDEFIDGALCLKKGSKPKPPKFP